MEYCIICTSWINHQNWCLPDIVYPIQRGFFSSFLPSQHTSDWRSILIESSFTKQTLTTTLSIHHTHTNGILWRLGRSDTSYISHSKNCTVSHYIYYYSINKNIDLNTKTTLKTLNFSKKKIFVWRRQWTFIRIQWRFKI